MKKFRQCFLSFVLTIIFAIIPLNQAFSLEPVRLGIDNLDSYMSVFENKKVGLVTNATAVASSLKSTIDILFEKVKLVAIFAPEHGVRGDFMYGEAVNDETDSKTGLTIHSLYGSTKKPTAEMLKNIDILVYDIQDVGARFYTYISTMKLCMEACKENDVTFVVLDRPNPVSGAVQGTILSKNFKSFVGISEIVQRYGLTPGEIAKYFNIEDKIDCSLIIIEMTNYKKDMYYDETGLRFWIKPSPSILSLDTAIVYSGTCIFEGTNISEGRGTERPFEYIGAPWINSDNLAKNLNSMSLPGVTFRSINFTPNSSKFKNEACYGVFINVFDRKVFNPIKCAFAVLYAIMEEYPERIELNHMMELLTGGDFVKERKYTLEELFQKLDLDSLKFERAVEKYRIY